MCAGLRAWGARSARQILLLLAAAVAIDAQHRSDAECRDLKTGIASECCAGPTNNCSRLLGVCSPECAKKYTLGFERCLHEMQPFLHGVETPSGGTMFSFLGDCYELLDGFEAEVEEGDGKPSLGDDEGYIELPIDPVRWTIALRGHLPEFCRKKSFAKFP